MKEIIRFSIDRKLKVAVEVTLRNALFETGHQIVGLRDLDDALQFAARNQAKRQRGNDAEQPVSARYQAEQLGVLLPVATNQLSPVIDKGERLYITNKRFHLKSAAMSVGGQCSTEAELIRARLFLCDAPLFGLAVLGLDKVVDQVRPGDTGFDRDLALPGIEVQHPFEFPCVEQYRVCSELLGAHSVTSGGDGNRLASMLRVGEGRLKHFDTVSFDYTAHCCGVELRVDVID